MESDPEYGKPLGTPVDEDRVKDCFEKDLDTAISECEVLYEQFNDWPDEVQQILVNMMFYTYTILVTSCNYKFNSKCLFNKNFFILYYVLSFFN